MKTLDQVKVEIKHELSLIRDTINFKEYLSSNYFTKSFIEEMAPILEGMEKCNCGKGITKKSEFESILLDIALSYKEREDIIPVIQSIFSPNFIDTKILQ